MIPPASRGSASLPACAASLLVLASTGWANAADCALERQGEGRVATVVDARNLRLEDGREIRLAGIERGGTDRPGGRAALSALVGGREVTLHGDDDTADRYGRQGAFVFVTGSEHCCAAVRRWQPSIYPKKIALQHWPPPSARPGMPNWAFGLKPRP